MCFTIQGAMGITMMATIHTPGRWTRRLTFMLVALGGSVLISPTASAAGFGVNTTSDTVDQDLNNAACLDQFNKCSLRAAIMQANKTPGKDTITLPTNLGTYNLGIIGRNEDAAVSGDLDITESVDIVIDSSGGGLSHATIDAGGVELQSDRVFHIVSGNPTVNFSDLIIQRGVTNQGDPNAGSSFNGAGVLIDSGTVNITNCRIQNNRIYGTNADFFTTLGGGIHVGPNGKLTLTNSLISANTALAGGGLSNQGTMNIRGGIDAAIQGNHAPKGGGGGIANLGGYLSIGQISINNNDANLGGGIYNEPQNGNNGSTNIVGADIESNKARQIMGQDPENPSGAQIPIGGIGGGIVNLGPMSIQRSVVNGNSTLDVAGTAIGSDAGGIYNSGLGNMDVVNVTISGNTGRSGGGVFTTRNMTFTNVTLFGNRAEPCTLGGSCDARGATGGNELSVFNTNPGVAANDNDPDVVITNSILADGTFSNNAIVNSAAVGVCAGTSGYAAYITSGGYNIGGDASCDLTATTDRSNLNNNTDPSLLIDDTLLSDSTGITTKVHKLLVGSPAINQVPSNIANPCPLVDQRNMLRGYTGSGDICDIGAYEFEAGTLASNNYVDLKTTVTDRYDPATVGQQNTYTITVANLYDTFSVTSASLVITVPGQLQVNLIKTSAGIACPNTVINYTITCPITSIAPQDRVQVFIDVTPQQGASSVTVTAEATVPKDGGQIDAFPGNNKASQTTEIKGSGDGSTNFGGTGGGGNLGVLLWIALAGWAQRRFYTTH
jgi:CSLREA domain-containing protein